MSSCHCNYIMKAAPALSPPAWYYYLDGKDTIIFIGGGQEEGRSWAVVGRLGKSAACDLGHTLGRLLWPPNMHWIQRRPVGLAVLNVSNTVRGAPSASLPSLQKMGFHRDPCVNLYGPLRKCNFRWGKQYRKQRWWHSFDQVEQSDQSFCNPIMAIGP